VQDFEIVESGHSFALAANRYRVGTESSLAHWVTNGRSSLQTTYTRNCRLCVFRRPGP